MSLNDDPTRILTHTHASQMMIIHAM